MSEAIETQCACCAKELRFASIEELNAQRVDGSPEIVCLECRPKVVIEDVGE